MAGGSNTAYNFRAINAAAVPGIGGTMSGFNENLVGAAIICINGEYLVEESPEMLYTNSFVIASGSSMQADRLAEEGAASINNDEATEANFQ